MGNSMSYLRGRGGSANDRLGYDGAATEPYDSNMPRLRGGDASQCLDGATGNLWFVDTSADAGQASYGRLSPAPIEDDFYEVPASDFYATRDSRRARRKASPVAAQHVSHNDYFDFNDSQQPNPWHSAEPHRTCVSDRDFEPKVRSEAKIEVGYHLVLLLQPLTGCRSAASLAATTKISAHIWRGARYPLASLRRLTSSSRPIQRLLRVPLAAIRFVE
jgi:hypothetical protein